MPIADLDHHYRFPDTDSDDRRELQDELDITGHRDYTDTARERIMTGDRRERYETGEWTLREADRFPAGETTWVSGRKILEHDLATTDPDDPEDAYFLVKNAEMSILDGRSEAVAELAALPDNRVYMPETLVLPYGDREAEVSRFVPNVVFYPEPTALTADEAWHATADEALHDFMAFNYWVNGEREEAANFGYTPDANIVLFDQHPHPVGDEPDDLLFSGPYVPDVTYHDWDHDLFLRSAARIGAVTDGAIEDALRGIDEGGRDHDLADADEPVYDIDGLRERRDILRATADS